MHVCVCVCVCVFTHLRIHTHTHTNTRNAAGAGTPGAEKPETSAMEHLDKLGDKMEKKIEKMFGVGKTAGEPEIVDPVECMLPRDGRLVDQNMVVLCIRLKNLEWAKKQTKSLEHDLNLLWQKVMLLWMYVYVCMYV